MALGGSAIYYTRKLYKSCFQDSKLEIIKTGYYKEKLATMVYFVSRPIFSAIFAILLIIGMKSGIIFSSENKVDLSERFVYLVMFLSFFLGFLSGKFINKLENNGTKYLDRSLKEKP